ncbi:hypothetical protein RGF97_20355 [Streptomyces roseicoloratus]|uniref:Lipoprotein n=1 Tax=Streptomyces roseicoloratus TaxID=2508722 RepID=A0ABY9RZU7_9ACTN|nr:hypothetical protein [Streptomyces roseicoloratus]WMX46709.1 hypothetical protein RGF97_20355 [Streptomyces roseicoloratus]
MATCTLAVSCTSGSETTVKERDSAGVQEDVEKTSSGILDMLGINGKVTKSGAMLSRCSGYDDEDEVYRARHPWSVHDVPFADMEQAMERLRTELPKNGWTIVKDGTDGSKSRSPQIIAESSNREFALDARLYKANRKENSPDLINVAVESACFKAK